MSGIAEFTADFFDDASRAWRANKIVKPEGTFRYKRNAFSRAPAVRPVKKVAPPLRRSVRLRKLQKKRVTK